MIRLAIFIPTYNATKTLPIVLDRIPPDVKEKAKQIFVIDNASPDNTYLTGLGYKALSGLENIEIFKNDRNIGYGGSQKRAYRYAIDNGFDVVAMLHGDAQYAPEKLPTLLEPFERGESVDLVFGSRMAGLPLKGGMPLHRFLGNKVLTAIQNRVLHWNLSEYHSGYRVYSCAAIAKIPFELCSNDYHFDTEILIQFKLHGLRVKELPIPTYYGDEKCYVNVWKYGLSILRCLMEYVLHQKGLKRYPQYELGPTGSKKAGAVIDGETSNAKAPEG